jgi:hypothetical protein
MNKAVVSLAFMCLLLVDAFIYRDMTEIKEAIRDHDKGGITSEGMIGSYQEWEGVMGLLTAGPVLPRSSSGEAIKSVAGAPIVDVRAFGAKGDGTTDDTKAIQAAVDSLKGTGGTVVMHGNFVSGKIDIPSVVGWITIELMGNWRLKETLVIPPYVRLSGKGGANAYVQFTRRPQARLISPPGDVPTVKLIGTHSKVVENVLIIGSSGKAILLQNGALATLDNVSVLSDNKKTAYPLVIDAFFWVWIRDSVFASPPGAGESIYITASPGSTMPQSGLVEIRNTIISGNGIKLAAEKPIFALGAVTLTDVVFENGTTPFLMLDSTNVPIGGIQLDRVLIADRRRVKSVIELLGKPPHRVSNVFIHGSPPHPDMPLVEGGEIRGLFLDGSTNTPGARWDLGSQRADYSAIRDGIFYGRWSGQGSNGVFNLVPYRPLNVNQNVDTWSTLFGFAEVKTGVRAPDGTPTAALLMSPSGRQGRRVFSRSFDRLAVGDWFIVGGWLKSESPDQPPYALSTFGFEDPGNRFSNGNNVVFPFLSDVSGQRQGGWIPVVSAFKVSVVSGRSAVLFFDLAVDKDHPTSYWKPFAIYIPVSASLSDDEVLRMARYMVPIPSEAPANSYAVFPHQILWGANLIGLRGLSGTQDSANNLRGSLTISGKTSMGTVSFGTQEPDANYFLTVTPTVTTGSPPLGSNRIRSVTKTRDGFRVELEAMPGDGNSVTFDWHLIR